MKRVICMLLAATALTTVACEDTAKKAEEAKKAAEETAKAAATKASAEVAEKAKEASKAMLDSKKSDLKKTITDKLAELDRKATAFKEKTAKLPGPVKLKADEAFKKYDAAKAMLTGLTGTIDGATDLSALADLPGKITGGVTDAGSALTAVEEIITKKK
jgi:hypothetical protein